MKLIIDIPEDMYIDANILLVKEFPEIKKIIAEGTPLPQGEWIVSGYIDTRRGYVAKCSCCKEDTVGGGNFCPNCGADMRKEY